LHDAGLEEPASQSGIGSVVEKLLPFGTTTYSRTEYQAALDSIAATTTSGYNFSLTVPSANFDRGMQLLADAQLHPALRTSDLAVVKADVAADLTGDESNPDHLVDVAQANDLYPQGDPARRFATAANVSGLTQGDVRAYFGKTFRPDLTTIVIVGDVSPETARDVATRWFGDWKADGATPQVYPLAVNPNKAAQSTIPATGRIQDTVRLIETVPLTTADAAVAPLDVANTVLSGDFSSMLIRDLRVTTGYVYYVGSTLAPGKTRSTFSVQYGSAPQNVGKAEALALADLTRMQTTPIDSERLLRAKARLLSTIPIDEESYDGLARQLLTYASEGLPLDEDVVLGQRELGATDADVRTAMQQYIRPQDFVTIVEGPPSQ
jgi:zinc protease